ncbi:MAG: TRAP transporter small permease subunit [Proteobacteria bacterium]|nr:TRAP transporter small permease subunit [Pseudomonadota bacterium]
MQAAVPAHRVAAARARACLYGANDWLARAAKGLVALFAGVMVGAIVWQVVTRGLIGRSPPWTEEVALLMFTWIVLLMTAICVREHLHVRVATLVRLLPPAGARAGESAIALLVAAIAAYLLWAGSAYLLEMRGAVSQAIRYPSELLYLAMPVASVLLLSFALENAVRGASPSEDTSA